MSWQSNRIFIDEGFDSAGPADEWSYIDDFYIDYGVTEYWWKSTTQGNGMAQWNNGMAIRLLVDKCNDLQEQINEIEGGEVTMAAILNSMLDAEYEQFRDFIGYIDGYRVALWNNWFNSDYYAALARGFKERSPER